MSALLNALNESDSMSTMTNNPLEIQLRAFSDSLLQAHGVVIPVERSVEDFSKTVESLKDNLPVLALYLDSYLDESFTWREYFDAIALIAESSENVKLAGSNFITVFVNKMPHAKTGKQLFLPATKFPLDEYASEAMAEMFLRGSEKYRFPITANIHFLKSRALSPQTRSKLLRKGAIKDINVPITTAYFDQKAVNYMKSLMPVPKYNESIKIGYSEKVVSITLPAYIASFALWSPESVAAISEFVKLVETLPKLEVMFRIEAYAVDENEEPIFINYFGPEEITTQFNNFVKDYTERPLSSIAKTLFEFDYDTNTLAAISAELIQSREATAAWLANPNVSRVFVEKAYELYPDMKTKNVSFAHPDLVLPHLLEANAKSLNHFQERADAMDDDNISE